LVRLALKGFSMDANINIIIIIIIVVVVVEWEERQGSINVYFKLEIV